MINKKAAALTATLVVIATAMAGLLALAARIPSDRPPDHARSDSTASSTSSPPLRR